MRASRGKPERPSRYYAKPILTAIALVFLWQIGFIPAALRGIQNGARVVASSMGAGERAVAREQQRRQIEKIQMTLAATQQILDIYERDLNREKGERLRREIEAAASSDKPGAVRIAPGTITTVEGAALPPSKREGPRRRTATLYADQHLTFRAPKEKP